MAMSASAPASGSDTVALPSWLLVALLCLVGLVFLAMFVLTAYSLSAPRSTLKNVLGRKGTFRRGQRELQAATSNKLVRRLALAARVDKRTTRTTLAIASFALLGVVIIAIFGASGQGVRDLRSQVVAAVTTLAATIAGFYFGAQTASGKGEGDNGGQAAVAAAAPEPRQPVSPAESQPASGSMALPAQPGPENAGNAGNFQAS